MIDPDDDAYLMHYGVKGMRWGVRKRRGNMPASNKPRAKTKHPVPVKIITEPGKRARAVGGQNLKPSVDAQRARRYKQKAKASSIDALSDKELKALVNRMNLEQQYNKMTPPTFKQKGARFVKELFWGPTRNSIQRQVNQEVNTGLSDAFQAYRDNKMVERERASRVTDVAIRNKR